MDNKAINAKKILLTFDYEVFFLKSGTFEKCILEPVDSLILFFEKHGIVATFFIDTLYYFRLLELEETRPAAALLKQQLQRLVLAGNRIEPHLHPHWLDAIYVDGGWEFPHYERYRLQSLSSGVIADLFRRSCSFLEEIASEVQTGYKVMSYRAGGWCIQPFEQLKPAFEECGIKVDSSVASLMKGSSKVHSFDFSHVLPCNYFRFNKNPAQQDLHGELVEIPISTFWCSSYAKVMRKLKNRFHREELASFGDGSGIPIKSNRQLLPSYEMVSLERTFPGELSRIIKHNKQDVVNIISHPKGLSRMSFKCLSQLVKQQHQFLTIKQYYEQDIMKAVHS